MKLPIRTLGLAVGALLIGSALAPVSAQQQSGMDGQVALRSDGALYLITGGQRRWISTVAATDEEINALPEGDPVFAGLAPQGSPQANVGPTKPSTGTSATGSGTTATPSTKTSSGSTSPSKPSSGDGGSNGEDLSSDIPIEVDIGGSTTLGPGDSRAIEIKTRTGVVCELVIELPDDDDITEDSKNADSRGRCRYTIEIPGGTDEGNGKVIGTVREGGRVNRQEIDIEIED